MTMTTHPALERDPFQLARDSFETTIKWLSDGGAVDHSLLEAGLEERGREVLRLLYQAQLDELSWVERREAARAPVRNVTSVRSTRRQLEATIWRVGID